MKAKSTSSSILAKPDFSRQLEIHTDPSAIAIGAALIQRDEGGQPVVASYFTRKLKEAEVKYLKIGLVALAVAETVKAFDPYVYECPFLIVTAHRHLLCLFSRKIRLRR